MRHVRTLWLLAVIWTVVTHFGILATVNPPPPPPSPSPPPPSRSNKTDSMDATLTTKRVASRKSEATTSVTALQKTTTASIGQTTTTPTSTTAPTTTDRMNPSSSSQVTQAATTSPQTVIPSSNVNISAVSKIPSPATVSNQNQNHTVSNQTTHSDKSLVGANVSSSTALTSGQTPASVPFGTTPTTATTKTTTTTPHIMTKTATTTTPTSRHSSASPPLVITSNTTLPISTEETGIRTLSTTNTVQTNPTLTSNTTTIQPSSTAPLTNRTPSVSTIRTTSTIDRIANSKATSERWTMSSEEMEEIEPTDIYGSKDAKGDSFDLKMLPLNKTVTSTQDVPYKNIHANNSEPKRINYRNESSGQLNISLPDDGEIVLSDTGMWTTPGKLSATKVIRLGYLTGSQIRESNESSDFYNTGFYRRPGQVISGALTLAVVEVNNNPFVLPEHRVEFLPQETYGEETESILQTTLLLDKNISVYIGPQETCMHEARLAAVFNIPMISYYCSDYTVSDKSKYPTFIRTKPTESQISRSVASLLMKYNWTKVTFIYSNENEFQHTAETIIALLKSNNISVTQQEKYKGPYFHNHEENPFAKIVARTFVDTRIYLMLGQSYDFVGLMANLYERGLLDTGEYFVVGVYLNYYDFTMPAKYLAGTFESDSLERIALAFKYYIGVIHTAPVYPEYKVFTHKVNKYLERPPFNHKNPYKVINIGKIVRPEAAYLYDAVKLYADAADSAWRDGKSIRDGHEIFKRIRGRTFKSVSGFYFRINTNGDAEGNFSLIARRFTKGKGWGLYPVGVFRLSENLTGYPTFHLFEGENISWPDGKGPPLDEPPCGYRGEKCIPEKTYIKEIITGVVGGIAVVVIVILVIIYRNWKYEQDLASLLWKIDYRDITFREPLENTPTPLFSRPWLKSFGANSNLLGKREDSSPISQVNGAFRASQLSLGLEVYDNRHLYTRVGTYKGQIVAVRKVNKKHVELTRTVRKELKVMRELRHPNINSFIGASVDGPYVLIVSEYCSKGSLQDILENDEMQLDQMFTDSLVHDIILGMIYLHDSEVKSHGKLKSSNCVVDSRWVLKITDFGLHEFMSEAKDDIGEYAYYRNLLWCSPELLRDKNLPRGTQTGDVYSFAVILFEIYSRKGPYGDTEFTPKEIIERVRRCHNGIPFRPRLAALETTDRYMTDVIKECWDEDPNKRPDFKSIRQKLKPLLKGMKSNIFDNMMGMMEKYASNLETVIQDRTGQLIEEKKKTEELLLRMLPRSVAEQLKRGKKVEAELFDSVTIYLSDICGFTAMSSESSPMQVVDLLNDLYTLFDSIIGNYDVYKVETIGDAYMVVSGLPKKNGILHAGEIASMSLHLLVAIKKFRIHHRPKDTLKLRIGVHSGSCVSGVVGQKMPRYCLFGDTVNTASRMESTGQPLRIHCSQQCKELLDQLGGYEIEERGIVHLKGKGNVTTYWIVSENKSRRQERMVTARSLHPNNTNNPSCEEVWNGPETSALIRNTYTNPAVSEHPDYFINTAFHANPTSNIPENRDYHSNAVPNTHPVSNAIDYSYTNAISNPVDEMDITSQNSPNLRSYMRARWNGDDPTVDSYYLKKDKNRRQDVFHLSHRNILIGSGCGSYDTDENNPENSPLLKTNFIEIDTDENLQVTPV